MSVLLAFLKPLEALNSFVGSVSRYLCIVALALMVLVILLQVFCRYALNNALPWPDEAARFLMLWLTGLMAPVAMRQGGFVAIDSLLRVLPSRLVNLLSIFLLAVSILVLYVAIDLSASHLKSGWMFKSSSLKLPYDLFGGKAQKMPLAWMFLSLWLGFRLMMLAALELFIRQVIILAGGGDRLLPIRSPLAEGT
ncbi:MAG: C4-dicarboxylate ABC transporter permease [Rhodobacteraceae bacterium]|nr:C4-dicarboxylate ABC transporter permease [Paracoccaceae bacterium]|tara:strand:+ start:915 stop:1499 length:585 start_codon:yes stop_codon:yes gene_type:complete